MRIISGHLKGRRIQSIKGSAVRPTADHVREALFNILAGTIADTCVLDLFAGTGALGIEALSRGAKKAVFIEKNSNPLTVLKKNIDNLALTERSRIFRWDITRNLNCLKSYPRQFSLVFMDPPYNKHLISPTLSHLQQIDCLVPGAMLVAEHERTGDILSPHGSLILQDQRNYGQTTLSFLSFKPQTTC